MVQHIALKREIVPSKYKSTKLTCVAPVLWPYPPQADLSIPPQADLSQFTLLVFGGAISRNLTMHCTENNNSIGQRSSPASRAAPVLWPYPPPTGLLRFILLALEVPSAATVQCIALKTGYKSTKLTCIACCACALSIPATGRLVAVHSAGIGGALVLVELAGNIGHLLLAGAAGARKALASKAGVQSGKPAISDAAVAAGGDLW